MTRLVLLAVLAVATLGACDKPTPEACHKALVNMQHLLGNTSQSDEAALASQVRACRGGSSKASVECATKAASVDDLKKCEFLKGHDLLEGSAGSAGSAK